MSSIEIFLGTGIIGCGLGLGYTLIHLHRLDRKLTKIFQGGTVEDADELIEAYAEKFQEIEKKLENSFTRLSFHDTILSHTLTKVVLKRFNPFQDMGGDTSFIAVLLDQGDNGILITNITMREGSRLYAKRIEKGVSSLSLSREEQKALDEAIHQVITK